MGPSPIRVHEAGIMITIINKGSLFSPRRDLLGGLRPYDRDEQPHVIIQNDYKKLGQLDP